MDKFPETKTSCKLKWAWSTLYLNRGLTNSCHRTAESELTVDNFDNFHNTPVKLSDRKAMINGEWPESSCQYCKKIELAGGVSDRMRQKNVPYTAPVELKTNPLATNVTPTHVEVFFSNVCNMACLYCMPEVSSQINTEYKKFGNFSKHGVNLAPASIDHYPDLVNSFWNWFDNNFQSLSRLHILGGEPFYQTEFYTLLQKIESNPNPNCELNVVTNLKINKDKLKSIVDQFKSLLTTRCLKRIDITCSIDCWGPEQEYVRWGMDVGQWEENFKYLCDQKWLKLNINQTISPLTIKTMPDLLVRLAKWRETRKIGHWFSVVTPGPSYMFTNILGNVFDKDFERILELMPEDSNEDIDAKEYMEGIAKYSSAKNVNVDQLRNLVTYLDEKDRRRGTNWEQTFPWLIDFKKYL